MTRPFDIAIKYEKTGKANAKNAISGEHVTPMEATRHIICSVCPGKTFQPRQCIAPNTTPLIHTATNEIKLGPDF
jgi:hypothetical protein